MQRLNFNKRFIQILFFIILGIVGCQDNKSSENEEVASNVKEPTEKEGSKISNPSFYAEGIPVYEKFEDMEPLLRLQNDTTYVVNFWATWCKPCIKEIPYFKELDSTYKDQKFKLLLVSLDFPKDVKLNWFLSPENKISNLK